MKKIKLLMLAAILTICGTNLTLTSCSESIDMPVVPFDPNKEMTEAELQQAIAGLHIDASDYVTGEEAFRVWDMKSNNTFTAYDLYYDDSLTFVVDTVKGTWKPLLNQSIWWDKTATDKLQGFTIVYDKEDMPFDSDAPDETYFAFRADDADDTDNDEVFFLSDYALNELATLDKEETEENAQARRRAAQLGNTSNEAVSTIGQGLAAGVTSQNMVSVATAKIFYDNTRASLDKAGLKEYFNPNDDGIFTPANWRKQKSILLYDKNGMQHYTDGKGGNYNFTQVELPWSDGTVVSNLPLNFCDKILPETGWELVMNSCGRTDIENSNYFALYNKYTGQLRFFVFVPQAFTTTDINDHAWEVTLSDELAQHLGMKYGLPMDTRIVNKGAIGMGGTEYNVLVSPWLTNRSDDGLVTPRPGWWAFDVDLSLYRPGFTPLGQKIRVQMDGWQKSQVSLNSTIKAEVKEKKMPDTYLNTMFGMMGEGKKDYLALVGAITALPTAGFGGIPALFSAAGVAKDFVKGAINFLGKEPTVGETPQPYFVTKQYIEGTIDTKGLISSSTAITNMYAPTYNMNQFETKNSTLGQGVWNLTTKPVVYQFTTVIDDRGKSSFFKDMPPAEAVVYVFDPTSVEVKLNPNVFDPKEVESVYVSSLCVVRKDSKASSSNDYRKAFGMNENKWYEWDYNLFHYTYPYFTPDVYSSFYDYLAAYNDKDNSELKFPTVYRDYDSRIDDKNSRTIEYKLVGRGNDDYLIEPLTFAFGKNKVFGMENYLPVLNDLYMPCFEIAVVVSVKMAGVQEPFVYKRTYIPEIRTSETRDVRMVYEGMKSRFQTIKNNAKMSTSVPVLEQQLNRAKLMFEQLQPSFEKQETLWFKAIYPVSCRELGWALQEGAKLFDNNLSTHYWCGPGDKDNGAFVVTFQASRSITPKSYQLVTSSETKECKGTNNPRTWELLGQKSDGSWVRLDKRDAEYVEYEKLAPANGVGKIYAIRENAGKYLKFQLRVYSYFGSVWASFVSSASSGLSLAELKLFEEEPVTFTCEKSSGGATSDTQASNLIDDNHYTRWLAGERVDGKWFIEFKASRPISPKTYYFLSSWDSGTYWDRTPKAWKMYGKKNAGDEWTLLSDLDMDRGDDAHVPGESIQKSSVFKFNKQQPQDMQYFRLEITSNFGSSAVQLNELIFNY